MPKNPPPPNSVTVRLNGCSREQNAKRTDTGWPMNGTVKPAPMSPDRDFSSCGETARACNVP
jgi:hypothetical protein